MAAVVASSSDQQPDPLGVDLYSPAGTYRSHLGWQDSRKQALKQHGRAGRPTKISKPHASRIVQPRKSHTPRSRWGPDKEDSRQLAADPNLVLPGDRSHNKPRLERQEAFHQPKTQLYHTDVVDDDSELYKLGLLYDDEHTRGSYFNLNTIVHSDPVYLVRPTKRAKKQRQDASYLYLDLSFSSLESDIDVQQFLASDVHEIPASLDNNEPAAQKDHENGVVRKRSYRDATLSVIPELLENSKSSLEPAAPEAADSPDFPDLISDEEEEGCPGDWALLEKTEVLSTADADVSADAEDAADAASAAGEETWVVLGDGS
ncbi:hypothetical protein F4820DRAFT_448173 [Hypoxylon rubiginosum]|uniref:Uncharacterized protein n=1 Tax=Hypoxylon rubiginosum TaxID=110542 RepID=A0ACB9Z0J1_9PEZI|nr:hypothetical protein F4820DRAFT_448173 [Hypoxylon rubiginosum]